MALSLLSIRVDDELKNTLAKRAGGQNQTPSGLVRTVIDHYLGLSEQELSGVLQDVSATANTLQKARAARDTLASAV